MYTALCMPLLKGLAIDIETFGGLYYRNHLCTQSCVRVAIPIKGVGIAVDIESYLGDLQGQVSLHL